MNQDKKNETSNQILNFKYKDLSISGPASQVKSFLPSILSALVCFVILYGVFFTDKITPDSKYQAAALVVGALFALIAIIFLFFKKVETVPTKNKEKIFVNQDGWKYLTDSVFVTTDQEILHDYIKNSFSMIENGDEVFQSYIGAFPISGSRDLIEETPQDNNVKIDRLFVITSPYEINFLSASEEKKKSLTVETSGKHKLNNKIFQIDLSEIGFRHIANITLFNSFVLITFKTRKPSLFPDSKFSLKRRFPPLFADNTVTLCLGITGGEVSKLIKSDYVNRIIEHKSYSLDEIKKNIYQANPVEYLAAIGYSVGKEVAFLEEFNPYITKNKGSDKLGYIGLVGSLAEILKNEDYDDKIIPNDIDLLFFISNQSLNELPNIYNAAKNVAKRYSIEGLLKVEIDEEMRPRFGKTDGVVMVQIIINDYLLLTKDNTSFFTDQNSKRQNFVAALKPSNFTMATRLHCNIPLYGNLSDFYTTQNVQYKDILADSDQFSVTGLIKIVENMELYTRFWDQNLKVMKEEPRKIETDESTMLYKYCIKWGLINLFFASTRSPQLFGINFNEIISQMSALFDISKLETNQLITKEYCLNILKKIQQYALEKDKVLDKNT